MTLKGLLKLKPFNVKIIINENKKFKLKYKFTEYQNLTFEFENINIYKINCCNHL